MCGVCETERETERERQRERERGGDGDGRLYFPCNILWFVILCQCCGKQF